MPKRTQTQSELFDLEALPVRPRSRGNFASAAAGQLPPPPPEEFRIANPLVCENTRFNADRTHRFTLYRHWGDTTRYVACIGMNPSGACEHLTDNTVNLLCTFARDHWTAWNLGAFFMLNSMSIRLTDSQKLPAPELASLPENDVWIRSVVRDAALVVVCWGVPGHTNGRGKAVEAILREECDLKKIMCLGFTKDGAPKHPLRQAYTTPLVPYSR
jgi:hypothetical protein